MRRFFHFYQNRAKRLFLFLYDNRKTWFLPSPFGLINRGFGSPPNIGNSVGSNKLKWMDICKTWRNCGGTNRFRRGFKIMLLAAKFEQITNGLQVNVLI